MVKGKVKFMDHRRGWGFVTETSENGKGSDYFFHYKDIVSDKKFKAVEENQPVTFEIAETNGRVHATNVTAITE